MGLGSIVSTVMTVYKADTSDQRKELKKLKGEEKKRHQALLDQTEAQNSKLDSHIAMWSKVAVGIGAATVAAKALSAGFDTLQKNTQLRAATVGLEIEGLRSATSGLVDDTRLLEFASKAMNGTFKLSQVEMENALNGALALRKSLDVDLAKALDATQKSITEGTTEPLKELGLVIKGAPNDTEAGLQAVLGALGGEAAKMGGDFSLAGDGVLKAGTDLENAYDSIKESLGQIAVALAPAIQAFAELVGGIMEAHDQLTSFLAGVETRSRTTQAIDALVKEQAELTKLQAISKGVGLIPSVGSADAKALADSVVEQQKKRVEFAKRQLKFTKDQVEAEKIAAMVKRDTLAVETAINDQVARNKRLGGNRNSAATRRGRGSGRRDDGPTTLSNEEMELRALMAEASSVATAPSAGDVTGALTPADIPGIQEKIIANHQTIQQLGGEGLGPLATIFGTPEEIDATAMALQQLTTGFDGLANAFGAGVDALITGSKSFSAALKDAIGQSLRAMAVDMSINALRHGAMAIGALAIGGPLGGASASAHGKAAAAYAAGAVVAGAAASQFSVNRAGGVPSAGAGAGTAGVGQANPGANGPANGNTQITIFDDDFVSMSPRERQARLRSRARSAGFEIEGDVVVNG